MKKLLLGAIGVLTAFSAMADLNGNGFYRLQNGLTKRYIYLLDDKGKVDMSTTSADVGALNLYLGFTKASTDPSTVFYLENQGGSEYNVGGQGTDLYSFLGSFLKIIKGKKIDGQQGYLAYASKQGMTKYLGDIRSDMGAEKGYPSADAEGDCRYWYIHPMSTSDDNYFGIAPTLTAGGKYYHTLYAGFPMSAYSAGVKFYVVSRVEPTYGVAVISEVTGKIPAGTPVIVECANPLATDNRLTVGPEGANTTIPQNYLTGTYFDNDDPVHYNRTPYDKTYMRSLGVVDGKLAFVKGNYDFMPRNEAVLKLPDTDCASVDQYKIMTEAEFNEYVSAIGDVVPDGYYRIQNAGTQRYAYMLDNSGSATDVAAMQLYSGLLQANSDPASVMYAYRPANGSSLERNISSQSADTKDLFGGSLSLSVASVAPGNVTYNMATGAGTLGDSATSGDKGSMAVGVSGDAAAWKFNAITNDGDNHFGVAPTVTAGGKYYQPFMAGFNVAAYSEGVKFYTVTKIDSDFGIIVLNPVDGVIPAGTPVIVECQNPLAASNRLTVGATGNAADVSGNMLSAVYYDISESGHNNSTAYDASIMRSLTAVNGKLAFAAANLASVPRNQAYISLTTEEQKKVAEYSVMTVEDYNTYLDEINGIQEGYYRMQNAATDRIVYLMDDKASLADFETSDLRAFQLKGDKEDAVCDPATVFSFSRVSSAVAVPEWNFTTQNTSFSEMLSVNMKLMPAGEVDGTKVYDAYAEKDGKTFYFGDSTGGSGGESQLTTSQSAVSHQWKLNAVDAEDDENYFGIVPTVSVGGKYYRPFMAAFPFTPCSDGMKVYYISKIDAEYKAMVLKEISGVVPAGEPVIVECQSDVASDNRVDLLEESGVGNYGDNVLKGVLFESGIRGHLNRTQFDKDSMRVLGAEDGKLMYIKADLRHVPRNQAYIQLDGDDQLAVDGYKVLTEQEYIDLSGVTVIPEDSMVDVYSLDGTLVRANMHKTEVQSLPQGFYIIRSGKASEKMYVK